MVVPPYYLRGQRPAERSKDIPLYHICPGVFCQQKRGILKLYQTVWNWKDKEEEHHAKTKRQPQNSGRRCRRAAADRHSGGVGRVPKAGHGAVRLFPRAGHAQLFHSGGRVWHRLRHRRFCAGSARPALCGPVGYRAAGRRQHGGSAGAAGQCGIVLFGVQHPGRGRQRLFGPGGAGLRPKSGMPAAKGWQRGSAVRLWGFPVRF